MKTRKVKTERQKLVDKLDDLWKILIKELAGWKCEYCGRGKEEVKEKVDIHDLPF